MAHKIINKRSSIITDNGSPKLPSSDSIEYGEIAINYADGVETISIKNSSNNIVEFKSKEYIDNVLVDSTNTLKTELQGEIDANVEQLNNSISSNANQITEIKNIIPTKVSEIENDSNFITSEIAQQLIDDSIADLDMGGSSGGNNTEVSTKGGTVLFEALTTNANFSDVTLSQSSSNFTQLDICCCTDVGETVFISVYNPNGQVFNVSSSIQESGELIIKSKQYEIRNSNILSVSGLGGMISVSFSGIATIDGNYVGIYKVIGYR